ncbi:YrhK family protein [Alkalibacterium sp. MB6]|uniref:YrhK family protein n=1 Tax=Alkalibacterium sp. MB6 TaxID=2081965 RepID=UPI00137A6740
MPKVETKEHKVDPGKEQDLIIKVSNFRLYFQNYYTLVSLLNDLLTGLLYLAGSILQLFTDYGDIGMYLYLFGGFFLLMRPVLKIAHNVFFYKEEEYRRKVLGEETGKSEKQDEEDSKPTKEIDVTGEGSDEEEEERNNEHNTEDNSEDTERIKMDYNEEYYGDRTKE